MVHFSVRTGQVRHLQTFRGLDCWTSAIERTAFRLRVCLTEGGVRPGCGQAFGHAVVGTRHGLGRR